MTHLKSDKKSTFKYNNGNQSVQKSFISVQFKYQRFIIFLFLLCENSILRNMKCETLQTESKKKVN